MTRKSTLPLTVLAAITLSACGDFGRDDSGWMTGGDGIDLGDLDAGDQDGLDGDGGVGDGSLDGADDGLGEPDCASEQFELGAEPPSVMLVLDKSSSMSDERWMQDGQSVTRWSSLHGVVSDLVGTYDATIDFGATMFPAVDSGHWQEGFAAACGVSESADVATAPGASGAILDAMPRADVAVQGATPASAGMVTALGHLALEDDGPRAVLLVTDGLANCAADDENGMFLYDERLPQVVQAAYEELNIPTYVVGIDIRDETVDYAQANAHEVLDQVARVGGVAREGESAYYAASDPDALYEAMDQIAARIECTVPLAGPVPEDASFEVMVDGMPMTEITDCATEDGWRFTDADQRSTLELCGQACDALRVEGRMEVQTCEDGSILPVP